MLYNCFLDRTTIGETPTVKFYNYGVTNMELQGYTREGKAERVKQAWLNQKKQNRKEKQLREEKVGTV